MFDIAFQHQGFGCVFPATAVLDQLWYLQVLPSWWLLRFCSLTVYTSSITHYYKVGIFYIQVRNVTTHTHTLSSYIPVLIINDLFVSGY
jgi:hypothetical protein